MSVQYDADTGLFRARTVRVHAPNVIEATLNLGFGIGVTRLLRLDNVSSDDLDEETRRRAAHCLVVLVGGKSLLAQVADTQTYAVPVEARVYLNERTYGRQVGHTFNLSDAVDPVLELSPFMGWLGARGFDVDDVKRALNGNGGHRGGHSQF